MTTKFKSNISQHRNLIAASLDATDTQAPYVFNQSIILSSKLRGVLQPLLLHVLAERRSGTGTTLTLQ
jgi:hypothetical protein